MSQMSVGNDKFEASSLRKDNSLCWEIYALLVKQQWRRM
jgi:hypothetical protein